MGEVLILMILGIMFTLPVIFGIILFAFMRRRKQVADANKPPDPLGPA